MRLKVCGLTKLDQIQEIINLEMDFLGFIFYEKSPRFVLNHLDLATISEINHPEKVGVFVNENLEKVVEISSKAKLNYIQLHGNEDEDYLTQLREKLNPKIGIIKVIRIGNQTSEELQNIINHHPKNITFLLFDTDSSAFGGTGKSFDWQLLNEVEIPFHYFLSGGISLENVNQVSNLKHQPFALDINSKFEIEAGNKDLKKIKNLKKIIS